MSGGLTLSPGNDLKNGQNRSLKDALSRLGSDVTMDIADQ
jgi:hypothetical protein